MKDRACSLIPHNQPSRLLEYAELCDGINLATWMEFIFARIGFAIVCKANDAPVGVLLVLRKTEPNFQVQHICVSPAYRDKGIGRQLLQFACEALSRQGAHRLYLYDLPAQRFAGVQATDLTQMGFGLSGYARNAFQLSPRKGIGLPALIQHFESRYQRFLRLPDTVRLIPLPDWSPSLWRVFELQAGHAYPNEFHPGQPGKFAANNPSFALVESDQPVGWIIYRPAHPHELLLDSLYLKPEWRKPAWFLILILASLKTLPDNLHSVRLFVDHDNRLMLPLMEHFAALTTSRHPLVEFFRSLDTMC